MSYMEKDFTLLLVPKCCHEDLDNQVIKLWLKLKIARYRMPYRLFIVKFIPTTATGKVNKQELINIVGQ